ncbi:MAG TPA: PEP-CTERM sorting domain-containing protein [Candidatus Binatia bacterium]|nr:PEP-CTERM sorting domain-containing protein [Candidatus Binatia bacterium]
MENAVSAFGDPVYWDENSGIGCHSPGCPSQAGPPLGSDPSEAFTILGDVGGTGSVPEPGSLLLFGSAFVGIVGILRRKPF